MKNFKITLIASYLLFLGTNSFAQTHDHSKMNVSNTSSDTKMEMVNYQTDTIQVSGNCDMCKARIEKAAKLEGVSKAEWSKKDKKLVATFDPAKTNRTEIEKKVAAAGHDTKNVKATDAVYNKLPGCCKYR